MFNLVHCECLSGKAAALPAQRQHNNRTTARQHDFVSVIQLQISWSASKPGYPSCQTHQAVIQHSGDIPALNTDAECGSFVAFVKQFRLKFTTASTVLLISPRRRRCRVLQIIQLRTEITEHIGQGFIHSF